MPGSDQHQSIGLRMQHYSELRTSLAWRADYRVGLIRHRRRVGVMSIFDHHILPVSGQMYYN